MTVKGGAQLLNHLLHCERGAAQAYDAILKFGRWRRQLWPLHEIAENHRQAVGRLTQGLVQYGEEPSGQIDAIVWSGLQRDPQHKTHEDLRLLTAMRAGELHETELCRWALDHLGTGSVPREVVFHQLLPMLSGHVEVLDQYINKRRAL